MSEAQTLAFPQPPVILSRADELVNTGARLFGENQLEPARLHFLAAVALDPRHATAWQNLGAVLRNMQHYHAAMVASKRSVTLTEGKNPYCLSNLGVSQLGLKQYGPALRTLREVAEALPNAPSIQNYGLVLYMMGRHNEALAQFEQSLQLQYQSSCASDRSLALLSLGKVAEGLEAYECRWENLYQNRIWKMHFPEWKGEDLRGRKILVHHEQGFGDSLMLVRFVQQLSRLQCNITLAMPKSLVRLCRENFKHITVVDVEDETAIHADSIFDYHSPLLSVMRWLNIRRPDEIDPKPYLTASGRGSPMALPGKKKIGIVWASGDHAPSMRDRRRLVPLPLFLPLLDNLDVSLISLQKGDDTKDIIKYGLEGLVFDVSPKLDDFADTADVISELDLVISVDSAVVHLAAAMGKPTLMLSPYTRCWRWWGLPSGRPWYEKMLAFTQSLDGTWDAPMKALVARAAWIVKGNRDTR